MKNIVITGSTRGIGLAMAEEFLISGCSVTISGRKKGIDKAVANKLDRFKDNFIYVQCDVRKADQLPDLWQASVDRWGSIDIWINNAGLNCPYEYCYDTESDYVDSVIDTNIKGMIFGSQIAAKKMLQQGSGQIWNMEGLGSDGMIQEKTVLYGTTKRALTYFTSALAKELKGTGVTAGRLSPGMMLTDFITKTPRGEKSPLISEKSFKNIFNILADRPETVAGYLVPKILKNTKNNRQIAWLTKQKVIWRFLKSIFVKRRLIKDNK